MALPPALRTSTPISVACGSTVTTIARRACTGRLAQRASPGASERSVVNRPRNCRILSILPEDGFRMSDFGFQVEYTIRMVAVIALVVALTAPCFADSLGVLAQVRSRSGRRSRQVPTNPLGASRDVIESGRQLYN